MGSVSDIGSAHVTLPPSAWADRISCSISWLGRSRLRACFEVQSRSAATALCLSAVPPRFTANALFLLSVFAACGTLSLSLPSPKTPSFDFSVRSTWVPSALCKARFRGHLSAPFSSELSGPGPLRFSYSLATVPAGTGRVGNALLWLRQGPGSGDPALMLILKSTHSTSTNSE